MTLLLLDHSVLCYILCLNDLQKYYNILHWMQFCVLMIYKNVMRHVVEHNFCYIIILSQNNVIFFRLFDVYFLGRLYFRHLYCLKHVLRENLEYPSMLQIILITVDKTRTCQVPRNSMADVPMAS